MTSATSSLPDFGRQVRPYRIAIATSVLDDLRQRLERYRPPAKDETRAWADGVDLNYLSGLLGYWRNEFDWRAKEAELNRLSHHQADIGETALHFVYERGRGAAPMPLLLVHGWPDGFHRFGKLIPYLTDPASHGGDADDAFDVVVPSLPGSGFSPRGAVGPSLGCFGDLLHRLMTDTLGYRNYGAHGGDIGAVVCDQLYRRGEPALAGVHLTNVMATAEMPANGELTAFEKRFLAERDTFRRDGGAYAHIQGTTPWTVAVGLNDSPAALAAWIVEKMRDWSDCAGDIERRFSRDEILTNVMLYWATGTIGTSILAYRDLVNEPCLSPEIFLGEPALRRIPVGFAIFPKDIANAPREWAERFYDVQHWSVMPKGGHFAAWKEPELLADDLRRFFRPGRQAAAPRN